jgi:hypothetical protein
VEVKKIFKLNAKKLLLLLLAEVIGIIAHNLLSALLGTEEAFFFILSVLIIPAYFLVAVLYSFRLRLSKVKGGKESAKLAGIFIITAYGVLVSQMTQSGLAVMLADVISGFSVIGIAVLLFPFLKRSGEQISKIYLYLKTAEGLLMIFGGIVFLFGMNEVRSALYDGVHLWVFIAGGFLFYYLLYKTELVPKFISIWGAIAIFSLLMQTILGFINIHHPLIDALLVLIITNEVFLAIWLMAKGIKTDNLLQMS